MQKWRRKHRYNKNKQKNENTQKASWHNQKQCKKMWKNANNVTNTNVKKKTCKHCKNVEKSTSWKTNTRTYSTWLKQLQNSTEEQKEKHAILSTYTKKGENTHSAMKRWWWWWGLDWCVRSIGSSGGAAQKSEKNQSLRTTDKYTNKKQTAAGCRQQSVPFLCVSRLFWSIGYLAVFLRSTDLTGAHQASHHNNVHRLPCMVRKLPTTSDWNCVWPKQWKVVLSSWSKFVFSNEFPFDTGSSKVYFVFS